MGEKRQDNREDERNFNIMGYVGRLILVSLVLFLTSILTPGFSIHGLWAILLAALVITILDYLVERLMKVDSSPFTKGIKGFVISALILYLTQFIVPNMKVSILGAILASIVIGVLDAFLPGRVM